MPKFRVLRPIEHDLKLYLPADTETPEKAKSAAHGGDIPVNASGTIELSKEEAAQLTHGQVSPIDPAGGEPVKGPKSKVKKS